MDPTTTFCPNSNCPARGQIGQGNIGIHSQKEALVPFDVRLSRAILLDVAVV